MKEDILEQIVEDYIQSQGYFTRHNVKFLPRKDHPQFNAKDDSNDSDIDVPCLSGCYPHPLNVGWTHSPEYSPSKVGAAAPPAIPSSERN
ncbi:MAG: hypothetical protein ABSC25_00005, partial [Roseiarcus sp.]